MAKQVNAILPGVDVMQARAYLGRLMLRRILACLALITGLAAIGTPAELRATTASQQVETCTIAAAQAQQLPGAVSQQRQALSGRKVRAEKCPPRRSVLIYIPTIQWGPDRALE